MTREDCLFFEKRESQHTRPSLLTSSHYRGQGMRSLQQIMLGICINIVSRQEVF
nr:MAG TPA: hypothetical protein [Bacteriophage sp.]